MALLDGTPATASDLESLALTNYGHFTSMRVDDGTVRGLSLHLARLARDCQAVFNVDLDTSKVRDYIRTAISQQPRLVTVRVTIYDPSMTMGTVGRSPHPQVLVTTRPAGQLSPDPLTARTARFSRDTATVKHIGLFSQLRHRRQALASGADDVVFVEADGTISEGATWNLGFVDPDGQVVWPDAPVLAGTTMQLLQQAHTDWRCSTIALEHIGQMRAAFATNVSIGVRAVRTIDATRFDVEDPVLDVLRKTYAELPGEAL